MEYHRCLNIDWLSLFGSCDYSLIFSLNTIHGFEVIDNLRGTRMFKKWVTVFNKGLKLAELCYDPFSLKSEGGIYVASACTLQISNRFCYDVRLWDIVDLISSHINFNLRCVSRVDIALDFHKFDNGLTPKNLILGFYSSKYLKKGYAKALGVGTQYNDYHPETLSFKGKNSAISFKLYNKSQEMRDVREKRYIQDCWLVSGLTDGDVWRLEVSIRSDGRSVVNLGSGELLNIGPEMLKDRSALWRIYYSMVVSRFSWLVAEFGVKRSDLRTLVLLKDRGDILKPVKVTSAKDFDRKSKIVRNAVLEMLNDPTISRDQYRALSLCAEYLADRYRCSVEEIVEYKLALLANNKL